MGVALECLPVCFLFSVGEQDTLTPSHTGVQPAIYELEGKTVRQQNPHPPRSLGWLAWIVARMGGWNCYYKPPGPKTMAIGWHDFTQHAAGFLLARQLPQNV